MRFTLSLVSLLGLAASSVLAEPSPVAQPSSGHTLEERTFGHHHHGGGLGLGLGLGGSGLIGGGLGLGLGLGAGGSASAGSNGGGDCACANDKGKGKGHGGDEKHHAVSSSGGHGKGSHHGSGSGKGKGGMTKKPKHKGSGGKGKGKGSGSASAGLTGHAGIEVALKTCTKKITTLGIKLEGALEGVNKKDARAIVKAISGILAEIHVVIQAAATVIIKICGEANLKLEVSVVAQLVAGLLNALCIALKPLVALVSSATGLVLLLSVHLGPIILTIISLLHALFVLSGSLLIAIVKLLRHDFKVVFKLLGCHSLLVLLELLK
ncbi:hypothetical protein Rhopal_006314-T1 [Rhodotorula paludigena]|uniref:Uncharacterized protein n=1 Tax=Rhodotorula paludigena TaxID=86838 RepID=A0AAV5GV99_9BASI|nr:hypothetical protein Rhopal_006314-T1 [Rhodotorula paludigena]